MAEVSLKNVSKIYDGKHLAVKETNLEIKEKEFLVLVGPSGCGKSTLLRMIAGLEEITSGEIYIDGKLVNNVPPKDRDISMVFQNYALYPHMTVFENIAFGLKIRKYDKEEIKQRVEEAAAILDMQDYLERKPKQLSGGQRQRVAVGRSIVRKPKVFLFDEPLSNLDAKLRVQMRIEISKLHNSLGATMIYVTHDQTEAMTMGDRIVLLKEGTVQQIDKPLDLYNRPSNKFVASFIGSPPMNFINGRIELTNASTFISSGGSVKIDLKHLNKSKLASFENKQVVIGIRPEDIKIVDQQVSGTTLLAQLVEPLGNETLVYFEIDGIQAIARVPSSFSLSSNSMVNINFDTKKIHFFESEKEIRLDLV
jgi:multiple sugar transport system ATP-binding protein